MIGFDAIMFGVFGILSSYWLHRNWRERKKQQVPSVARHPLRVAPVRSVSAIHPFVSGNLVTTGSANTRAHQPDGSIRAEMLARTYNFMSRQQLKNMAGEARNAARERQKEAEQRALMAQHAAHSGDHGSSIGVGVGLGGADAAKNIRVRG